MSDLPLQSPDETFDPRQQQGRQARPPQTRVKAWRLFELQRLLREKPQTVQELARYFDVDKRSIQRDLQAMIADGQGVERRGHTYALPVTPAALNAVEALAVHAAVRLLYHHSPGSNQHYREGLVKLAAMLPEPARSVALRSTEDLPQRPEADRAFEVVAQAWFERRVLRFDYRKPGQPEPERGLEVQVYFAEVSRADLTLHVIGFERSRRRAVRTFKLAHMQSVVALPETFAPEWLAAFDPREYLTDAWGVVGGQVGHVSISLRFTPEAAPQVLGGGFPGLSEVAVQDDGSVTARIRAGVDDTGLPQEVWPFLLSWGPRVEVLGPRNVRARWLNEVRELLARYGGDTN